MGKTTLAAALSRTLARRGRKVVAVDADPNPNLGIALGVGVEATERLDSVVNFLLRQEGPHGHEVPHGRGAGGGGGVASPPRMEAEELLDRIGVFGPDGVRLIQTGRIDVRLRDVCAVVLIGPPGGCMRSWPQKGG